MPIANSDHVVDPFPGIALPSGTGLPGTDPPGTRGEPDDVPATVTSPSGTWWAQTHTRTHGTGQPGQLSDGWTGSSDADFSETGAGQGHTDAWHRYPWQQSAGA